MQPPALDDTIVAVSSAWQPSPVGVLRISGPRAFDLVATLGVSRAGRGHTVGRVSISDLGAVPVDVFGFTAPRSYTGQDIVELHAPGALPLLRALATQLITRGARRALPGEFTARAFINRKLDVADVQRVLELIQTGQARASRQDHRAHRVAHRAQRQELCTRLTDLLARLEAGIDFVDEEDVRFLTPDELTESLATCSAALASLRAPLGTSAPGATPHVALVGVPNAGKSTLFNALLGCERALVAPVLGTTRDVLSATVTFEDQTAVLQDCAGLGDSTAALEAATYLATERAAGAADLLLWVHAAGQPWTAQEHAALEQLATTRRILVTSKVDQDATPSVAPPQCLDVEVRVSAWSGVGMDALRGAIATVLRALPPESIRDDAALLQDAAAALARATELARSDAALHDADLVALELRTALEALRADEHTPLDEAVLGRIYSEFCVGK